MERHTSFQLPSPTITPYRTPSSSLSRRSPYEDMSPSSTPPPLPSDTRIARKRSNESQTALDENLSPLDPRRFTPTLHASLVSEILSLRRDLENKSKNIEQLEQSLDAAQSQNDGLSRNLLASNKEIRSVKRQMQLLEGGTLSALSDLSKERDDAIQETADLRKRLEYIQKRAKSHEDSADRTQALWEREKEAWGAEKRALETKCHVAEGRLKIVLEEVAQIHVHTQSESQTPLRNDSARAIQRPESRASISESPILFSSTEVRARRQSASSTNSDHYEGRSSVLGLSNAYTINLADELALDNIEEDSAEEIDHEGGRMSPDALPEEVERTRPESSLSIKARKVLGLAFDIEKLENLNKSHSGDALPKNQAADAVINSTYVDCAIQYSPPLSPIREVEGTVLSTEDNIVLEETAGGARDIHLGTPVMISTSSQTVETLPSPPLTPKQNESSPSIMPESVEKTKTKDTSTQTDPRPRPGASRYIHSRTSTHDLGIPTIAIFPPTSRPVTPETNVVLPPHTKNASCQADFKASSNYTSSSMQTEEIRIDRRNIFSPHFVSGNSTSTEARSVTSQSRTSTYPRRSSSHATQPAPNSSSKRSAPSNPAIAPINDDGPLSAESSLTSSRPVRSSSLFAGFDDYVDELEDELDDDIFYEDDFSSRPVAKFTLRSGKLVSQESTLEGIGESTAATAGEAQALDNLRKSENILPPELRQFSVSEQSKNHNRQNIARKAPSATKTASVRRAAMISNGVAAHQSKHSQSTVESGSNDGNVPPPLPIPLRYSSARIGKSYSESGRNSRGSSHNASPTRQYRQKYRPALRKARSGPAISPAAQTRRQRSTSPPRNSRVSIVPEMPLFEMPAQTPSDVIPPLTNESTTGSYTARTLHSAGGAGPRRSQNHLKQPSDPVIAPQTSVVDAIAQTMVGEWMFKYVRRRKSFGKLDKDWDPSKSVEELTNNPANAGARHKRWVWLAPYERAVLWSSKQPMSGNALLGKSGRKLTVKSVLDVKDDNPMPKNSLTGPAFNRSILILTPQRALKFTATSQERHFVWLTALSFLSHSPLSIGDLAALPPPPDEFRNPSPPPLPPVGGSFRRRTLRDSIRIAKGPNKQETGQRSVTDSSVPIGHYNSTKASTRPPTRDTYNPDNDVALPPTVKRFHTRNRSNTAPRPLQSSHLSFSQRDVFSSPLNYHGQELGSFERAQHNPSTTNLSIQNSRRGSEASAFGRPTFTNTYNNYAQPTGFSFSDSSHNASMTMRMDAFIDNKQAGRGGFRNLRLAGASRATNKDLSYWGLEENASTNSPADSLTPANTSIKHSDSTGRGSVEKEFFRTS